MISNSIGHSNAPTGEADFEIYRNFINSLPGAVCLLDAEGRFILYNSGAIEIWGKQRAAEQGEWPGFRELFSIEGRLLAPEEYPMNISLREKRNIEDEVLVVTTDGDKMVVLIQSHPFYKTGSERLVGVLVTLTDITEKKAAEAHAARLSAIIHSSNDAIISKTLEGIVTSWNPSAERLFGYTAQEMVGESITKIIPKDRLEEEPQILRRIRNGEMVDHFETIRKTKYGKLLHISLTISPIKDNHDKIVGVSKIARDISIIKEHEQRKDDFIKMASHELKTPVTSIKGYVQLLLRQSSPEKDGFFHKSLTTVDKQVSNLTKLINDLLDLTRIDSGQLFIQKEYFDITSSLGEVIDQIRAINPGYSISLVAEKKWIVYADRDKISQVLINYLTNAVKYSRPSEKIEVSITQFDEEMVVAVKDHGIGISADDQVRIFERFYRAQDKEATTYPGFGIGLFIVQEIIRNHKGRTWVESEKNKGSVFYFSLPLVQ